MTHQHKSAPKDFARQFPRCAQLPILPVWTSDGKRFVDGYDIDDLQGYLGTTRFNLLMSSSRSVKASSNKDCATL